jgi:acetyltransferase-like isoleucine patch superfamily enzyme
MLFSGTSLPGKLATWIAAWFVPPYYGRDYLSWMYRRGYISPSATIHHGDLHSGANIFIDDRVVIYQFGGGGPVALQDHVHVFRDCIVQTGRGGSVSIGAHTFIQPRCIFSAFLSPIVIGSNVQIAPNCAFYSYDHSFAPGELISKQPLKTRGGIVIEDDVWLGVSVVVLDGVKIGRGAVIGAGSVVTKDIPANAVAVGVPARVTTMRGEINS